MGQKWYITCGMFYFSESYKTGHSWLFIKEIKPIFFCHCFLSIAIDHEDKVGLLS